MEVFDAINIAEGGVPSTDSEKIEAWQTLINEGWTKALGNWFRETAETLIDSGICTPPPEKK